MKNKWIYSIIGILIVVGLGYFIYKTSSSNLSSTTATNSTIRVVAAENFYGDIAEQLGGSHVQLTSILSDPNVDPHEYEPNVQDGVAVAHADLVIKNGDDYDTWMDKLLSGSPNNKRTVLVAADIATQKLPDNPHVWYGVNNVKTLAQQITNTFKKDDPTHAADYDKNLATFDASLQSIQQKMNTIKSTYTGTPVALTETIFLYQTQVMGLRVLTPISFEQAIAEGNDPSADDVAKTNDQITQKKVKALIYNEQTVTPITTNLLQDAQKEHIPVVPVTETMPKNKHYQSWMLSQLNNLQQALSTSPIR